MEYFNLSDGEKLPVIGLGPGAFLRKGAFYKHLSKNKPIWFYQKVINKIHYAYHERIFENTIARGINLGYLLIDNSAAYGTSSFIRKAIEKSNRSREQVYLTTRASNNAQLHHSVREEFFNTLKSFNTKYVDLLQFHWPVTGVFIDTWKELIKLRDEGYTKTIGVANCNIHHLDELYKATGVMPTVAQFEVHPLFTQKPLLNYCKEHDIQVEAYTPIARADDRLVRLPMMKKISEKYNKSVVQIVIRWHIQQGRIPIIGARHELNQRNDIDVFDFNLTEEELRQIDSVNINSRLRFDPDNCDFSIL